MQRARRSGEKDRQTHLECILRASIRIAATFFYNLPSFVQGTYSVLCTYLHIL